MKHLLTLGAVSLSLTLSLAPVRGNTPSRSENGRFSPSGSFWTRAIRSFEGRSAGWYWVYEGVAHAQSFVATGREVSSLHLRVARLNARQPLAPLEVEVRDVSLREVFLQGQIRPQEAGRTFRWVPATLKYRAPLQGGKTYVLLLKSRTTRHDAPWLVNAMFRNLYPHGRHLGWTDDLFFALSFGNGTGLRVGLPLSTEPTLPLNSGLKGGAPKPGVPTLSFGGFSCPPVAARDPLGPVPLGRPAGIMAREGESPTAPASR